MFEDVSSLGFCKKVWMAFFLSEFGNKIFISVICHWILVAVEKCKAIPVFSPLYSWLGFCYWIPERSHKCLSIWSIVTSFLLLFWNMCFFGLLILFILPSREILLLFVSWDSLSLLILKLSTLGIWLSIKLFSFTFCIYYFSLIILISLFNFLIWKIISKPYHHDIQTVSPKLSKSFHCQ